MAKCVGCQKTILFGATKVGDGAYCGEKCADAAVMPAFAAAYDATVVQSTPTPLPSAARTGPDDALLVDREGTKPGLVIGIGLLVALLLSFGVHLAETGIDRQLRSINLWIVLPIGALLNGALISIGFFAAIRLLDSPPRMATYAAAAVGAGLLCWLTFVASYLTMTDDDGTAIREVMGFGEYMQVVIEESRVMLGRSSRSATTVGSWGYALYAVDCLGFMAGAWFVIRAAGMKPFCAKCGRFMTRLGALMRSSNDPTAAGATLKAVHAHLAANNPQRAVDALSEFGAKDHRSYVGLSLECHGCPMCKDYTAVTTVNLAGSRGRREVEDAGARFEGNGNIGLS